VWMTTSREICAVAEKGQTAPTSTSSAGMAMSAANDRVSRLLVIETTFSRLMRRQIWAGPINAPLSSYIRRDCTHRAREPATALREGTEEQPLADPLIIGAADINSLDLAEKTSAWLRRHGHLRMVSAPNREGRDQSSH
jgi:hypothetical protein